MKEPRDIIIRPLITEKATQTQAKQTNKVFLVVRNDANKPEIRHAVEAIWKVEVKAVNTIKMSGKEKRLGKFVGRRNDWKKAVVTLAEGHKIDVTTGL